ncbi:hypothetical protein OG563_09450 [Nocardia vinacea]|uniref:Helix-turn-helix domain-containing protein n=1 Tax=Nocardia vinacea TaxID=96468 RepID=A0ABZ1Z2U3_9NOCA|nr:hypothetical protein [Nocardia vinacea]
MRHTLTPDESAALDELLPPDRRTGDLDADLAHAVQVALARREDNARVGGAVIAALHRRMGSWRGVAKTCGVPQATARRWVGKALR